MINTVIFCGLSFATTSLGFWIFIRNFPDKRWKTAGMKILFWFIFLVIGTVEAWDAHHAFIPYLQIIFFSIINACFIKIFYTYDFKVILLWELIYNINSSLLKVPLMTIKGVLGNKNLLLVNVKESRSFIESIWCLVILLLIFICYTKWEKNISFLVKKVAGKNKIILLLYGVQIIEYCFLLITTKTGGGVFRPIDVALNSFMILSVVLASFSSIIYFFYKNSREEQINLITQQKTLLKEQSVIKEYYEQDAKRLHDIKHILLCVKKCIAMKELEKAEGYLEDYLNEVDKGQQRIWTGLPEVDFIVNYEHQKMEKKEIQFIFEADLCEIPIVETEFMVILGNLMDNAIEAAEKCSEENRKIYLKLQNINDMFILQIENGIGKELRKVNGHLSTTKETGVIHGWGLKNVKQIVQKNEGDYYCHRTEECFKVAITFFQGGSK